MFKVRQSEISVSQSMNIKVNPGCEILNSCCAVSVVKVSSVGLQRSPAWQQSPTFSSHCVVTIHHSFPWNDQLLLFKSSFQISQKCLPFLSFFFFWFPIKKYFHVFLEACFQRSQAVLCTPGLKMPIMYLSWLNLFKFVSVFPFSTLCCCAAFSLFTCAVWPLWYTTAQCTVQNSLSLFKDQLQIEPNQTV